MRTSSALVLAGVLLAASTAASAAPVQSARSGAAASSLSYNYLEGRVLLLDPDDGDDAQGIRLGGSMLIQPQLFVSGGLTHLDFDGGEVTQLDPTLGFRHAVNSRMDLVGAGSLIWSSVDCQSPCDDDDLGFGLTGGIRAGVAPQIELGGYVSYEDTFDDSTIELTGEGLYAVTRQLQLLAALSLSSDYNGLQLGARWNF